MKCYKTNEYTSFIASLDGNKKRDSNSIIGVSDTHWLAAVYSLTCTSKEIIINKFFLITVERQKKKRSSPSNLLS